MCGVTSENGQGCIHRDNVIYTACYIDGYTVVNRFLSLLLIQHSAESWN